MPRPQPAIVALNNSNLIDIPRSLTNQIENLSNMLNNCEQNISLLHNSMVGQENKFRQEINSVSDAFLKFSQDSDDKIEKIVSNFRSESDKIVQSSRSNIQGFNNINDELEGLVNRYDSISERLQTLNRSDNDLFNRVEETKQFFIKELEELRSTVLKSSVHEIDREDKKIQWQITLNNERKLEDHQSIIDRLSRNEYNLLENVDTLKRSQSDLLIRTDSLTKQFSERPPIDPNRVLSLEVSRDNHEKILYNVENSVQDIWAKITKLESNWEASTADGFRRIQNEARLEKEALSLALQDIRTVISTEITARRRDQETNRVSIENLSLRTDESLAKIRDEVRESTKYMNQYIKALDSKNNLINAQQNNTYQSGGFDDVTSLKFQAALTNTDARLSNMASQIDANLTRSFFFLLLLLLLLLLLF
jgi:hypothetical protein